MHPIRDLSFSTVGIKFYPQHAQENVVKEIQQQKQNQLEGSLEQEKYPFLWEISSSKRFIESTKI